jgi:hypothetical protein
LWAQETVNAEEEKLVPKKLKQLEYMVRQMGLGQSDISIYLEQSVDEVIDMQAYWLQENIILQQSCNDGSVVSWSGFDVKGLKPEICGSQFINVQLTTRQIKEGGKTILAFPTLYNDI